MCTEKEIESIEQEWKRKLGDIGVTAYIQQLEVAMQVISEREKCISGRIEFLYSHVRKDKGDKVNV